MTHDFPSDWLAALPAPASAQLRCAVSAAEYQLALGKAVFPPRAQWFAAFAQLPPSKVRVVILGQDPYPTRGNAMGLAFSVPSGMPIPASLRNIYKALALDLAIGPASHGDLRAWSAQGVLLLNSVLTVEEGKPNAHAGFGWSAVTDAVIARLGGTDQAPKVFMLWGAFAQKKIPLIDQQHLILTAPHPSPLSARRGFFDCQHFSKANAFLEKAGLPPIDWRLP